MNLLLKILLHQHSDDSLFTMKFTCIECPRSFSRKRELCRHERTHVIRPSCSYCGALFETKPSLRAHIKASHRTGVAVQTEGPDATDPKRYRPDSYRIPKLSTTRRQREVPGRSWKPAAAGAASPAPPQVASKIVDPLDPLGLLD